MTEVDYIQNLSGGEQMNFQYFKDVGSLIDILAGETIAAGNVVYIKKSDGKVYVSDTGTADDIRASGIALTGGDADETIVVQRRGPYKTSGLTANTMYYLGAAGALSTTISGVQLGIATSTTVLDLDIIQDDRDTIGTVKAYDKSQTGIPLNNLTAFWVECNGQVLNDPESPLNGQTIRDINITKRVIRGSSTSGSTGGADTHAHNTNLGLRSADTASDGSNGGYKINGNATTSSASSLPAYMEMVWIQKIK